MVPQPDPVTDRLDGTMLAGKMIFVAGATGSIGTAVCWALARHRAELVIHSHGQSRAAPDLAEDLGRRYGTRALSVHGDVTEPEQMREIREGLVERGVVALHAVVNCTTGFDGRPTAVSDLTVKEFRRIVDVDLVGSFVLVKELLPLLSGTRGGKIVFFSSLAGLQGRPGAAHLCAAKAGVGGLALGLARDLAAHGVLVHVVAPGPVGPHPGLSGVPVSTVEEVAGVVTFLSSPLSDPLGGQVLAVHGTQPAL